MVEAEAEGVVEAEAELRGGEGFAPVEGRAGEGGGDGGEGEEGAVAGDEVGLATAGDAFRGHCLAVVALEGLRGVGRSVVGMVLQSQLLAGPSCDKWSTSGAVWRYCSG